LHQSKAWIFPVFLALASVDGFARKMSLLRLVPLQLPRHPHLSLLRRLLLRQ
jgi:hypothetical protein